MGSIQEEIKKRILVLDGAMGTMIQQYKLTETDFRGERFKKHPTPVQGNNDLLCITRPDIIKEIHCKYLEAGADIIETNTFNSNRISMADYEMENLVKELNIAAVKIAKEACKEYTDKNPQKPRFVCGSIGPTNKTASLSPDVNNPAFRSVDYDYLVDIYYEQAEALIKAGADVLMVETVFDTLNAKAALFAIQRVCEQNNIHVPVMVSGTITDASGRTLSGQTAEAFLHSLTHVNLLSIGFNCSLGAKEMYPHLKTLAHNAPFAVSAHPNAGLPNQFGEYDQSPQDMSLEVEKFLSEGIINIIGGCCGTNPAHIAQIAKIAEKYKPHSYKDNHNELVVTGLEPLKITKGINFVNIGERTNVAGSKKFARLIKEKKYEEALSIAREQVEGGAQIIDINMDDAMLDAKAEMIHFLNLIASEPDISRVPIMIDSSKWEVIEAGLKRIQGKAIVNSLSLKEGEQAFLEKAKLVRSYGAALVVMAFDENGQADSYQRRIDICKRAYTLLTQKINFPPQDIIFDPNILTIATGIEEHNNYAVDFFKTVRWIKENLPHAKVSGGVSNVSFSFRGNDVVREAMHSVFLYHAIEAGMDMGIVNPAQLQVYSQIEPQLLTLVEDVILNRHPEATEKLIKYAETVKGIKETEVKIDLWRNESLEKRLHYALLKGISDYLEQDLQEALTIYKPALTIIEQPLMQGMNIIGDLFGAGKMFLPQVVKSARVMKKAVEILIPYIEAEKKEGESSSAGKILLATVKGDVHDIGKNIVGVVIQCNNWEVIDIGVMVPCETILAKAKEHNVDIIGLSGLITPSLDEMVQVAQEMQRQGFTIPLLIGGATTSKIHTAVKIDTVYNNPVVHVLDASKSVGIMTKLMDKTSNFAQEVKAEYAQLRNSYSTRQVKPFVTLQEARNNKLKADFSYVYTPQKLGKQFFKSYSIAEIAKYIDWTYFFHAWEMKGKYPDLLSDPEKGTEAAKLFEDAKIKLQEIIDNNLLIADALVEIIPANTVNHDDIELYTDDTRNTVRAVLYNLRQQTLKEQGTPNLCLADFIAPKQQGIKDYIGTFACVIKGAEEVAKRYEAEHDLYNSIMIKALSDRLAEAFAEFLHREVRTKIWGYAPLENLTIQEIIKEKYQGIRPASPCKP
ncbi:MAG: methionine synthase, partial [Bacteroidales bacterium]